MVSISTRTGPRRASVRRQQPPGGLDPVQLRHADVHQHDVGLQLRAPRSTASSAVGGLADHVDVVLGVEDHAEAGAHERLVVGDQHAHRAHAHRLHLLVVRDERERRRGSGSRRRGAARPPARRRRCAPARASRRGRGRRRRIEPLARPGPGRGRAISSSSARALQRTCTSVGDRAGVLERVGQRLLHDPVGGQVEPRGQRPRLAVLDQLDRQPGLARPLDERRRRASCVGCGARAGRPRPRRGAARRAAAASRPAPRGPCARSARRRRPRAPGRGRGSAARRPPGRPSR